MTKLLLVDGHALLYRAFHATSDTTMTTSKGEPTNATYGFAASLIKTLQSEDPSHVAVAFDLGKPTFRHEQFAGYKAHRPPMAEAMVVQVHRVREMVAAFGFPIYEMPGFEADDVIGTLATQAAAQQVETLILTGDLDTLQLVGPHVRVLTPRRGPFDTTLYDADAVLARYGLTPNRLPDFKALTGDASDNIPGVPGIGEKTASKLLAQHQTIEQLFEHLGDLPERQRKLLDGRRDQAIASKYLATIVTDVPVALDLQRGRMADFDRDAAFRLFTELEFRSLIDRLPGSAPRQPTTVVDVAAAAPQPPAQEPMPLFPGMLFEPAGAQGGGVALLTRQTVRGAALPALSAPEELPPPIAEPEAEGAGATVAYVIDTEDAFQELLQRLERRAEWSVDLETTGKDPIGANVVGIALASDPGIAYYIPVAHAEGVQLTRERVLTGLRPWLERADTFKIGHNLKYDVTVLLGHGIITRGIACDTMVAAYLLNPAQRGLGLKDQAASRFQVEMTPITALIGKGREQITMAQVPIAQAAPYAAADADMTLRLRRELEQELRDQDLYALFETVEMPLVPVLADMEFQGVDLDVEFLRAMSAELQQQFAAIEQRIFELVGHPFNVNSPRQLETVLFRERGLPPGRRTATGYSTDAEVLETLRGKDPVVDLVLEYRQLTKLRSTYVEGLPALINPRTGRVHTSFNQTIAATGRLSSSEPNLQNIPIRTELGHKVRRAFVSGRPGWVLLAADYSQIELRILAHLSGDERLLDAFRRDQDIHASTAALVFNVPPDAVAPDMRRMAKTINFGIIYGLSEFGLAGRTGVSMAEARRFIQDYNATYSGLHAYMERTREEARRNGYVTTLLNRRRYVPDVNSPVRNVREEALRAAINMPVQGAAADMIKLAMIRLHERLLAAGLQGRMILQVHDELLLRLPEQELSETAALVKTTMETALPLTVPVRVDLKWGHDWYTMNPLP
jgi:DNA polymerase-1